jgi:hypothetical protein
MEWVEMGRRIWWGLENCWGEMTSVDYVAGWRKVRKLR